MNYSAVRPDGVAVHPASHAESGERLAFIRKVYGLVFLGIFFFAASITLPIVGAAAGVPVLTQIFALSTKVPFILALLLIIGSSMLVHSVSMVRGWNLVAYFAMSFVWAFLTIPLVTYALGVGGISVIVQASVLTTTVFGALSCYVLISRKDFSFLGGILTVGLVIALGGIVMLWIGSFFFNVEIFHIAMSIFLVILFSGYVLYDTSNVIHRYATDMVVPAALALMVDFIILFRQILFLLIAGRD